MAWAVICSSASRTVGDEINACRLPEIPSRTIDTSNRITASFELKTMNR